MNLSDAISKLIRGDNRFVCEHIGQISEQSNKNTRGNRLTRERGQTDEQTDGKTSWGRQWPSAELAEG